MLGDGTDLAGGVRLAVEDLTARVSDLEGDTVGLADERWDEFVQRVRVRRTEAEGLEVGCRLIGYRELSFVLLVQLAEARSLRPSEVMESIGLWAASIEP